MKNIILVYLLLSVSLSFSQLSNNEANELKTLYKENYKEWISNKKIQKLVSEDKEIDSIIRTVSITETTAFQKIKKELETSKNSNTKIDFKSFFSKKGYHKVADMFIEVLDPKNTETIKELYWDIINDPKNKDIADLVIRHMEKAIEDLKVPIQNMANDIKN